METDRSYVFRCTDCSKEFSKRMDYNRHRKSHDRPYPCPLCGKAFGLKTGLERHKVTHESISAIFRCKFPKCRFRGTGRKDYFWRHLVNNHQLEGDGPSADKILRMHYNEAIREAIPPPNANWNYFELLEAGKAGDGNKIRMLLSQSSDNSDTNSKIQKRTALHFAAREGHATLAEILLENGVDLEQKSRSGETALLMAIKAGHTAVVKPLLENGASIHEKPNKVNGLSLLCMAVQRNQMEMVKLLLENGASIHEKSNRAGGLSPLYMAVQHNQMEMVKLLLGNGASIHGDSNEIYVLSPLYIAVQRNQMEMVKLLIENGSIPERISRGSNAPMHAIKLRQEEMVELLLKCGADVNQRQRGFLWRTVLHSAAQAGPTFTKCILKAQGNIEAQDLRGWTPLQSHVCSGTKIDNDVVRLLVEAGAKVTCETWKQFPPELQEQYADRCPI